MERRRMCSVLVTFPWTGSMGERLGKLCPSPDECQYSALDERGRFLAGSTPWNRLGSVCKIGMCSALLGDFSVSASWLRGHELYLSCTLACEVHGSSQNCARSCAGEYDSSAIDEECYGASDHFAATIRVVQQGGPSVSRRGL